MSKHALFGSPSSLARHRYCPGNVAYGKDIPDPPTSPHAAEGTHFHSIMEQFLPDYLDKSIVDAEWLERECDEYEDMPQYVVDTSERVKTLYDSFCDKHTDVTVHFELKVQVSPDCFGTADVVFVGRKKNGCYNIVVIDYKYGRGVSVAADENIQAIAYVLGAVKTLKIKKLGTAVVFIAQMRLIEDWHKNPVCRFSFKADDAKKYEEEILSIVQRVKAIYNGEYPIEGNLSAGDHCRWCKCRPTCVEANRDASDLVIASATELSLEDVVRRMTLDEQVEVFLRKSRIEDFLDAVAVNLKSALESGVEHEKIKLIKTKGRRGWKKDVEKKVEAYFKRKKITDIYNQKLKGIGELEKIAGEGALDHFITVGEGKIELVHSDDKRHAIGVKGVTELPVE